MKYCHGSWMVYTCSRCLFHCLTKWFNIRVGAIPSLICPNLMVFLWKENRLCSFQNRLLQLAFGTLFKVTWGHFDLSTVCWAYTELLWLQLWDFLFTSLLWDQQSLLYFSRETNKQTNLVLIKYFFSCLLLSVFSLGSPAFYCPLSTKCKF